MRKVTGSTNVRAFGSGSYAGLRECHFENEDRLAKGISRSEELEQLNQHYDLMMIEKDQALAAYDAALEEYNTTGGRVKNPKRRYSDIEDYIERQKARKNVRDPGLHDLSFMIVSKAGDAEAWHGVNGIINKFVEQGAEEVEVWAAVENGLARFGPRLNELLTQNSQDCFISQCDTNVDEAGAPHVHCELVLSKMNNRGLPETNSTEVIRGALGLETKVGKEVWAEFRDVADNLVVDSVSEALSEYALEHGYHFDGLQMHRTEAELTGLSHERYIQERELEAQIAVRTAELDAREAGLNDRERGLNEQETRLEGRERELNSERQRLRQGQQDLVDSQRRYKEEEQKLISDIGEVAELKNYLKGRQNEDGELDRFKGELKSYIAGDSRNYKYYKSVLDLVDYIEGQWRQQEMRSQQKMAELIALAEEVEERARRREGQQDYGISF